MKSFPILFLSLLPLAAQDIAPKDTERDPVLTSLLGGEEAPAPPAVTVNLDAVPKSSSDEDPVLVTGRPPEGAQLTSEPERPAESKGVRVEVTRGSSTEKVDAPDIKLLAPFPAKPLAPAPSGWKLVHPEGTPPISKTVTLGNGSEVTLSIRPHVLIPDADGDGSFDLSEPGYKPALQYAQEDTVGTILADSIGNLDDDSARLDRAARRLRELLQSLPATESPENAEPTN